MAVLAAAALSDNRHRRIPNWTVLATAALFAIWVFVGPAVSVVSSLEAAGVILLATSVLYAFNLFGAGDSKLMTAVALFAGLHHLAQFVLVTVLVGGLLAVASLVVHPARTYAMIRTGVDSGRGIPYGVAIALGGMLTIAELLFSIPLPLGSPSLHWGVN